MTSAGKITSKQRKNKQYKFTAGALDCSAPVKKLIGNLRPTRADFKFAMHNVKQMPNKDYNNYHFTLPGHSLNTFTDDWDGDLHNRYFEQFTYKSLNPKMLTKMMNTEKEDPVTQCMKEKKDWHNECHLLKIMAGQNYIMANYESLNDEVAQCPKFIVDMAAQLDSDPDPNFDSSYNWYYAGHGNMQLICIEWVDYLLHSVCNTVYLSEYSKTENTIIDKDHTATFHSDDNNILETICSSSNIIALRTKFKIYVLKLMTDKENITFEKLKIIESEVVFTGICFDNYHKNILFITHLDNKLTIVNLDRLTRRNVTLKKYNDTLVNNWSTVMSSGRVNYTHVAGNSITLYDKRTNVPSYSWTKLRDITDYFTCNDVTVAKQCEQSNSLYFGTDHHLFLMDVRFGNSSTPKVVQRWTHGMQCVPTYMSICNFEFHKEIICLSSQWCEDTCVIPNYINRPVNAEIQGVFIPYRPPSIFNALNEARQKLLCHDPYNPIDSRLATSITGNMIIENGENYMILMQNSLGDISCHTLFPAHMEPFVFDNSLENLDNWSKSCCVKMNQLEFSSIENISKVWSNLKKVPESHRSYIGQAKYMKVEETKFNKKEIFDAFESEQLDVGLLDIWVKESEDSEEKSTNLNESSTAIHLHFSDSD